MPNTQDAVPTIQAAITRFLKRRNARTAKTYGTGLDHFVTHLASYGLTADSPVSAVRPEMVSDFVAWLREHLGKLPNHQRISKSTLRTYLAAVVAWYGYVAIETEWIADVSITAYERMRRNIYQEAKVDARVLRQKLPSAEIIARVLAVVRGPVPALPPGRDVAPAEVQRRRLTWLRDRAIVEVFLSTGMRVGELVALHRSDMLAETRELEIVTTKGQRSRVAICSRSAWDSLQTYLQSRDGARHTPQTPLFSSHHRAGKGQVSPLSTRAVEDTVRQIAQRAGITDFRLTPHSFRHYFATVMLSATENLALVQRLLGHENPATTEIYAQVSQEQARAAHRAVFDAAPNATHPSDQQESHFAAALATLMEEDDNAAGR